MTVRFKVDSAGTKAHFSVEANDPVNRRFGVIADAGKLYVQYMADGASWVSPADLINPLQLNTWYVLRINLDDVRGFSVVASQESNPSIRGYSRVAMPAGKPWRFHHWIASNTASLDDYREFSNPEVGLGYDDSWAGFGKGRRTPTGIGDGSDCVIWRGWHYDARGRTTLANVTAAGRGPSLTYSSDSADRLRTISTPPGEVLTDSYDAARRPSSLHSRARGTIVGSASSTALDQPATRSDGNGRTDRWTSARVLGRLTRSQVGTGNRDYGYDGAGNVTAIVDNVSGQTQHFSYDQRDRLVHGWTTGAAGYPPEGGRPGMAYDQWYGDDAIGNLTSRTGVGSYSYGANGNGSGTGPHQARVVNGQPYSYDGNGNLVSGGGRSERWDGRNMPVAITSGGVTEYYGYDADGARATRTRGSVTTVYLDTQWEETASGAQRVNYTFNGQVVGYSDGGGWYTLHGDHLGSATWQFNASGGQVGGQEYHPWGWSAPRPGRS